MSVYLEQKRDLINIINKKHKRPHIDKYWENYGFPYIEKLIFEAPDNIWLGYMLNPNAVQMYNANFAFSSKKQAQKILEVKYDFIYINHFFGITGDFSLFRMEYIVYTNNSWFAYKAYFSNNNKKHVKVIENIITDNYIDTFLNCKTIYNLAGIKPNPYEYSKLEPIIFNKNFKSIFEVFEED